MLETFADYEVQNNFHKKVVLISCAHNEAQNIHKLLEDGNLLLKMKVIDDFVVIDDHSTDGTADIVKNVGVKVVPQKVSENNGKSYAWLQGVKYCREVGADIMITIDADLMSTFTKIHANTMLDVFDTHPKIDMVVFPGDESYSPLQGCFYVGDQQVFSGQRAIKVSALNFLFNKSNEKNESSKTATRFKDMAQGYGLELTLNWQFGKRTYFLACDPPYVLHFLPSDRRPVLFEKQLADTEKAKTGILARKLELSKLRDIRTTKKQQNLTVNKPLINKQFMIA
ncbi:MAG: glycosyltransferase [Candidatus Micrarchaeota archaeon]|nr:glycosyltransferase [Candidatus Micrarchaeota archaeon]